MFQIILKLGLQKKKNIIVLENIREEIFYNRKTKDLKEGLKTTIEGEFTRDIRYRVDLWEVLK